MVDVRHEQELAAERLMEAVFGHRRADRRALLYARAALGTLPERLSEAELERDAALARLAGSARRNRNVARRLANAR